MRIDSNRWSPPAIRSMPPKPQVNDEVAEAIKEVHDAVGPRLSRATCENVRTIIGSKIDVKG